MDILYGWLSTEGGKAWRSLAPMSMETLLLSVIAASAALADLVGFFKLLGSQSDLSHKLAWSFVLAEFPIMGLLFWSIARSRSAKSQPVPVRSR